MADEVSFMIGGVFKDDDGKVTVRPLEDQEQADIRQAISALAVIDPTYARAVIEERIELAGHAVAASLSSSVTGKKFRMKDQRDDVLNGLPYLVNIDDVVPPAAMQLLEEAAQKGSQ